MENNVQFSEFLLDQESFKKCSIEEKLGGIIELFDNNDEGILRRKEVRQILICLLLTKDVDAKEEAIEEMLKSLMRSASVNDYHFITKEQFIENIHDDLVLMKILK